MKTELFLTSSVHAVAHDIAKRADLSKDNNLVFIETAAEPEEGDKEWLENDRQALINAGFKVSNYTITGKSKDQLKAYLNPFNYVYLSGGNTAYLLEQSQKSGFISLIKELVQEKGKVYIGTSAGSIIAGPRLPDYFSDENANLKDRNGYGFVNFTILPHWGSEHFEDRYLGGRLKIMYKENQVPLVALTDNQYVHVLDGKAEIIDVIKD